MSHVESQVGSEQKLEGWPVPSSATLLHGRSAVTGQLRAQLAVIAPFYRVALVFGEEGSGRARVARELHRLHCPDGPFVQHRLGQAIHTDVETTDSNRIFWMRLMQSARGGTLVLDMVENLSVADQATLLPLLRAWDRAAGEGSVRPRVIGISSMTGRVLQGHGLLSRELVALFSAVSIHVRPLRERRDDIVELAEGFAAEMTAQLRRSPLELSPQMLARLRSADWPGNVSELRSVVRRYVRDGDVACGELDAGRGALLPPADRGESGSLKLEAVLRAHVLRVMQMCSGNKLKAAELLGVSRSTLYRMLEQAHPTHR